MNLRVILLAVCVIATASCASETTPSTPATKPLPVVTKPAPLPTATTAHPSINTTLEAAIAAEKAQKAHQELLDRINPTIEVASITVVKGDVRKPMKRQIEKSIARRRGSFRACYSRALTDDITLEGELTLRMTIESTGKRLQ